MTVSAHEAAATRFCKAYGCEREIRANGPARGPYAHLCDEHYEEQRRRFSAMQRGQEVQELGHAGNAGLPAPAPNGTGAHPTRPVQSTSLREAAQALVMPAANVDKAGIRKSAADSGYRQAREQLAAAVRQFQAALQELPA